jgi:hypothetical protein
MSKRKQGAATPRKGKRRRKSAKVLAKDAARAEWKATVFELRSDSIGNWTMTTAKRGTRVSPSAFGRP